MPTRTDRIARVFGFIAHENVTGLRVSPRRALPVPEISDELGPVAWCMLFTLMRRKPCRHNWLLTAERQAHMSDVAAWVTGSETIISAAPARVDKSSFFIKHLYGLKLHVFRHAKPHVRVHPLPCAFAAVLIPPRAVLPYIHACFDLSAPRELCRTGADSGAGRPQPRPAQYRYPLPPRGPYQPCRVGGPQAASAPPDPLGRRPDAALGEVGAPSADLRPHREPRLFN